MYINKLLLKYVELYSEKRVFKEIYQIQPFIVIPHILIIISGILFYLFFTIDISNKVYWILLSIGTYIISIFISIFMVKHPDNKAKAIKKYQDNKSNEFFEFVRKELKIINPLQIDLLEKLIANEIEAIQESKKIPFSKTINQLFVAVLITGLLSFSFSLINAGETYLAGQLILIYIFLLGTLIVLAGLVMSLREFSKPYKLKNIRILLIEYKLKYFSEV